MITASRSVGKRYPSEKLEDPGKQFVTRRLYGRHKLTGWYSHLFSTFRGSARRSSAMQFYSSGPGFAFAETRILDSARRVPAADEAI